MSQPLARQGGQEGTDGSTPARQEICTAFRGLGPPPKNWPLRAYRGVPYTGDMPTVPDAPLRAVNAFRPKAADVRRLHTLGQIIKGSPSDVQRLAIAHLERVVLAAMETGGEAAVAELIREDVIAVHHPMHQPVVERARPGRKLGQKNRPASPAPDAQPSAPAR